MQPVKRVNLVMTNELYTELKIIALLTGRTMSSFIRTCIREKIVELKGETKSLDN